MRVGISVFPSLASRKEPYYGPRLGLGYLELRGAKCDRECRIVGNDAVCVFILSTSPQSQKPTALVRKHIFIDIYMDLSVTIYFPACEGYVTAYAVQVK